ncbi:bifunctional endoribonuclease/protein kinase ire1 [Phlyctochytrium planicorne]|nr:bifunctional endoribonuclease/protein kinase ire1 [Phlyctochytrium planicorne]
MFPVLLLALVVLFQLVRGSPGGPALAFVDVASRSNSLAVVPTKGAERPKGPVSFDASDLLLVTTLDGSIHGVHKTSGRTLWTTQDGWGPLVHVAKNPTTTPGAGDLIENPGALNSDQAETPLPNPDEDDEGMIIPEPLGDGELYHYMAGMPIKRLPFSIKKLVENRPFTFKGVVYTSKKVSRLIAIDPLTGGIVRSFGDAEPFDEDFVIGGPPPIMLSRTEYMLMIYDYETKKVKYNITYGEFSTASLPGHMFNPLPKTEPRMSPLLVSSSVDGLMVVGDYYDDNPYPLKFSVPALSAFDVSAADPDGNHQLEKVFPLDDDKKKRKKKKDEDNQNVFIGTLNDTFYVLSHKNSKLEGIQSSVPAQALPAGTETGTSTDIVTIETSCVAGSQDFPKCLLGSHHVDNSMIVGEQNHPALIGTGGDSSNRKLEGRVRNFLEGFFGEDRVNDAEDIIDMIEGGWARITSLAIFSVLAVIVTGLWMNWRMSLEPLLKANKHSYTPVATSDLNAGEGLPRHVKETTTTYVPPVEAVPMSSVATDVALDETAHPIGAEVKLKASKKKKKVKTVKLDEALDSDDAESGNESQTIAQMEKKENVLGPDGVLKTIKVSSEVLGYGSHGTVVFKGTFENREVAIKRLLSDYHEVAHHEVKLLRDSDHHPNVIRYFYQETTERFMYIALELCPASLYDVFENSTSERHVELRARLKAKNTLSQIMSGIRHLHSLQIVHRDIKPQNILVAESKSKLDLHPRLLISDFGLCKRLADDQSSFHNTHNTAGGTVGWRAPECLLKKSASETTSGDSGDQEGSSWVLLSGAGGSTRITKSIDIFSAGCVYYYVLTNGSHPFGDRFSREINVLKGNHRLDKLDSLPDAVEAKDMVRRMIMKDPKKRLESKQVLSHPYFWSPSQKLAFLQDISDRLEVEEREPPSGLLKQIERGAHKAVGTDWFRKVDRVVLDNLGKFRKYDPTSVQDLLRALRNKVRFLPLIRYF